jgi:AraC-like DNA-binding protein
LSLDHVPVRERAGLYREFFGRSVMRLDVEPLRDVPLEIDVTVQRLPGLQLFSGILHGSCNRRTGEMLADGNDDVGLTINLGGPYLVTQGQRELVLGAGEATFISSADPCSFTHHPPGDVLAVRFPRKLFAPLVKSVDESRLCHIPSTNPALRLLTNYAKMAWDEQTIASPEMQQLVAAHVYDLVAVAIGASRDAAEVARGGGVRAARLHAIKQDIARHLDEAELSLSTLAARHGCTPRFVQRLFESEGTTLTDYVLAQRLARAHRMLLDPRRSSDKISNVAYDCGFGDISYFNRAFRRSYGVAPSDIRAQARRAAADS